MSQALQVFLALPTFVAYPHVIDTLQPQPFLPHGYRHPQGPLVVFESVSGDPGGSTGKLYVIQDDKNIAKVHLVEKSRERSKIWPAGRYDHGFTMDGDTNQKGSTTMLSRGRWRPKLYIPKRNPVIKNL